MTLLEKDKKNQSYRRTSREKQQFQGLVERPVCIVCVCFFIYGSYGTQMLLVTI